MMRCSAAAGASPNPAVRRALRTMIDGGNRPAYRYCPVFDAVSMAREPSDCLPDTSVRM